MFEPDEVAQFFSKDRDRIRRFVICRVDACRAPWGRARCCNLAGIKVDRNPKSDHCVVLDRTHVAKRKVMNMAQELADESFESSSGEHIRIDDCDSFQKEIDTMDWESPAMCRTFPGVIIEQETVFVECSGR